MDLQTRQTELRWRANPADQAALRRAIAGRRRSGQVLPGDMVAAQVRPARWLKTESEHHVWTVRPRGDVLRVGDTPGTEDRGLWIPPHRAWGVQPRFSVATPEGMARALRDVREQRIPGLVLSRSGPRSELLALTPDLALETLAVHQGVVSQEGLHAIRKLEGLTRLDLSDCVLSRMEADGRLPLPPNLHTLYLENPIGLERVGLDVPNLQNLAIEASELVSLDDWIQAPGLTGLRLSRCAALPAEQINRALRRHRDSLRILELTETRSDASTLHVLGSMPTLRVLGISDTTATPRELRRALTGLPLTALVCDLDRWLSRALPDMQSLRTLHVGGSRIHARDLANIALLTNLEQLDLGGCVGLNDGYRSQTDSAIEQLCTLTELRTLNLRGLSVTKDSIDVVARLPRLESLGLNGCGDRLGRGSLRALHGCSELRWLSLRGFTWLRDRDVAELVAALPALRQLDLRGCNRLTDAVVDALADNLRDAEELLLPDCVGQSALDRLRERLPRASVPARWTNRTWVIVKGAQLPRRLWV